MSKQYTFVIDLDQCIGCHACTIACKQENKVEPLQFWVRALQMGPIGKFPDLEMYFLPFLCQHCQEPACLDACPKGAIAKREADGIVIVDREKCQGNDKCATSDPCRIACPGKIDPEGYISLIAEGKPREALELFRKITPFAGVLGRVCTHTCETDCQRARYDEAVSIRALKRYMSDHELKLGRKKANPAEISKTDKVAVVGSGPAGLSCAYDLIRTGFPVTVFEAASEAGGLLRYGIPQYRLPKKVLDNEINYLEEIGVLIKTGSPVKSLDELSGQGFKTVFLATGAWRSQKLNVPGENATGVINALDFLNKVNSGRKVDLGKRVAVIGGGSVAIDSARIALRLGAEEVHVICLECRDLTTKDRMLAQASEIREAEEEGIVIHPSLGVHQILTENGQITGLEAMVCLSVRNQDGTFAPKFDDCNVSIITADSIIVAIGQALDKSTLPEGLKNITGNHIPVDPITLETEMKGVFAGGDAVGMAGDVISAIAAGKKAAISIERYLSGMDLRQGRETVPQNIEWVLKTGVQSKPRNIVPVLQAEKRKGFAEVELGFDEGTALEEARRCLSCGKCYKACPYGALSIGNNGGINKCTLCVDRIDAGLKPACLSVCPGKALHFGNLNDAESEVAKKVEAAGDKVHTLLDKGTHPSIRYILRRAEWREDLKSYNYQLDNIEGASKING